MASKRRVWTKSCPAALAVGQRGGKGSESSFSIQPPTPLFSPARCADGQGFSQNLSTDQTVWRPHIPVAPVLQTPGCPQRGEQPAVMGTGSLQLGFRFGVPISVPPLFPSRFMLYGQRFGAGKVPTCSSHLHAAPKCHRGANNGK